jgi:8-oxo-dGTP diphosphatase
MGSSSRQPHHKNQHGHTEYRFCPRCGCALERRQVKANEPKRLVCQACGFIFYQDPKLVAGTLFTLEGGIVLLRRAVEPAMGKWVFPGGYVDRGESVQDAALRETREESQLEVRLGPLLNVYSYPGSANVIVVYTAEVVGGQLEAADESDEARIFPAQDLPWDELAFESTKHALTDYLKLYFK